MKRLAALDPSFRYVGVIILDVAEHADRVIASKVFRTHALDKKEKKKVYVADHDFQQCQTLAWDLRNYFVKHRVGGIVAELPPGGTLNARAARCFGMMTGILATLVKELAIPIDSVPPKDVKRIVKPGATKAEMIRWAKQAYPDSIPWKQMVKEDQKLEIEHLADALAVFEAGRNGNIYKFLALQTKESHGDDNDT